MNVVFWTATLVLASTFSAFGQERAARTATPLSQLAEAQANNPQINAADHQVRAARQMAPQVTTLPDPMMVVSPMLTPGLTVTPPPSQT